MSKNSPVITTLNETSLHRSLKFHYSGEGGDTETFAGSFICDGRNREGELIEVQTGSFAPLRKKVKRLTEKNRVRIIHPIIALKRIELYDTDGRLLYSRNSPRKGSPWDFFFALAYAPELPLLKNLTIELAVIECVEKRTDDGKGSWRRGGVSVNDRSLGAWRGSVVLSKPRDYLQFVPFRKEELFTTRDLAGKAGITMPLARKTLFALGVMGLTRRVEKRGRAWVYARV
ncbi:MAG: 40S ribosomal protein S25 [Treponema sp.]|nr:40S ribosomal protein S25 [Treponema sp.]